MPLSDIRHMQYTVRSPMTERRSFRNQVENFRLRLTDPSTEGGADIWRPTRGEARTHAGDKKAR